MRVVLDTNVVISGLISERGHPGRLLEAVRHGHLVLITAPVQIREIVDVLSRPKIANRLTEGANEELSQLFSDIAEVYTDPLPVVTASSDPDDNFILAIAVGAQADLVVSGDKKHMVGLNDIEGIPIVSPAAAFDRFGAQ